MFWKKPMALAQMEAQGRRLQDGFNALSHEAGLGERLSCVGRPSWSLLKFRDEAGAEDLVARSLFSQEAAKRGVLILLTHNMTAAHDDAATEYTLQSYAAIFQTLSGWLNESDPSRFLEGEIIVPSFACDRMIPCHHMSTHVVIPACETCCQARRIMRKSNLLFRADASAQIGSGHVMRCSLWRRRGAIRANR
jgi:hypothetical protein